MLTARKRYEILVREMRIADNAEQRAWRQMNGTVIPPIYDPQVSFALLGLYAVGYPEIFNAACRTRILKRSVDKLPQLTGKYKGLWYNKKYRPGYGDIPF